ncbi:MAG: FecR family protein [Myxococcota bacterium]
MTDRDPLLELGASLRRAQDERDDDAAIASARAAFIDAPQERSDSGPSRALWLGGALALAAALILLVLWPSAPAVTVDGVAIAEGAGVTASEPQRMDFADGSRVALRAGTSVDLLRAQGHESRVRLVDGSAEVDVRHYDDTDFRLDAGPYQVVVTGTRFEVDYSAATETLTVAMHEGTVEIIDPSSATPFVLSAPDELSLGVVLAASSGVEPNVPRAPPEDAGASATPQVANEPADEPTKAVVEVPREPAERPKVPRKAAPPGWRQLAKAGKYAEALAAAESLGFSRLCKKSTAKDLLVLADAARFSSNAARAEEALQAVRTRFRKKAAAARAAFGLGRIAFDQRRKYAEAADWFRTYLRERPDGGLAKEALGRLLEAERKAKRNAAAKKTATKYLERYPGGAHAELAEATLR